MFLFYPKKTVKLEAWTIAGKVSKYEVYSARISLYSDLKTLYLDAFHAVSITDPVKLIL